MKSLIPIEERTLSRLRRITMAQLESVIDAVEDGGIDAWKTLGFRTLWERNVRQFVQDAWERGEAAADEVLRWAERRKGSKPLQGDSEGILAKQARFTLTKWRWDDDDGHAWAVKADVPIALALANVPPAEGLAWYQDYTLKLVGVAEQDLLDKTKEVVARGTELGLRPADMREELHGLFTSFPNYRLANIVRTECLTADHRVLTGRGEVPIQDVKVGDIVWTHQARWDKVVRTYRRRVVGERLYKVRVGCSEILATRNHPVLTSRGWQLPFLLRGVENLAVMSDAGRRALGHYERNEWPPLLPSFPFHRGKTRLHERPNSLGACRFHLDCGRAPAAWEDCASNARQPVLQDCESEGTRQLSSNQLDVVSDVRHYAGQAEMTGDAPDRLICVSNTCRSKHPYTAANRNASIRIDTASPSSSSHTTHNTFLTSDREDVSDLLLLHVLCWNKPSNSRNSVVLFAVPSPQDAAVSQTSGRMLDKSNRHVGSSVLGGTFLPFRFGRNQMHNSIALSRNDDHNDAHLESSYRSAHKYIPSEGLYMQFAPVSRPQNITFDGYVYNLETERDGSFVANGIYVHNSAHIYNLSSLTRYTQDSMITAYRYLVTEDDRTSEICRGYVDQVVPAGELRDVPPLHFQCRTVLEPIFRWEKFGPSDMSGVKPMRGFGGLWPTGTGLPGLARVPAPVPPPKPSEFPERRAELISNYKRTRQVAATAEERALADDAIEMLESLRAADMRPADNQVSREEFLAFWRAFKTKPSEIGRLAGYAQRGAGKLLSGEELNKAKEVFIGELIGKRRLHTNTWRFVAQGMRDLPLRHLAEARMFGLKFRFTKAGGGAYMPGEVAIVLPRAASSSVSDRATIWHEFAHFLTGGGIAKLDPQKARFLSWRQLFMSRGPFQRKRSRFGLVDMDNLFDEYMGRVYGPYGHGVEYPSQSAMHVGSLLPGTTFDNAVGLYRQDKKAALKALEEFFAE